MDILRLSVRPLAPQITRICPAASSVNNLWVCPVFRLSRGLGTSGRAVPASLSAHQDQACPRPCCPGHVCAHSPSHLKWTFLSSLPRPSSVCLLRNCPAVTGKSPPLPGKAPSLLAKVPAEQSPTRHLSLHTSPPPALAVAGSQIPGCLQASSLLKGATGDLPIVFTYPHEPTRAPGWSEKPN